MTPAEAVIMKARDRILQDVMTETPEEDRGRLLTVAIDSNMPNNNKAAFIDWIVVASIFSQARLVDLHDSDALVGLNGDGWHYMVNLMTITWKLSCLRYCQAFL